MSFIQELANSALKDDYLQKLIEKAEHIYGLHFLKKSSDDFLSEKEYLDIMRFADILSRDINCEGRNIAYKIISILYHFYKDDEYYKFICNSVMTKLGNFPSLGLIMERMMLGVMILRNCYWTNNLKRCIKRFREQKNIYRCTISVV